MSSIYFFGNCILNSIQWYFKVFYDVKSVESWVLNEFEVNKFISQITPDDYFIMQPHSKRLSNKHHFKYIEENINCKNIISLPSLFLDLYNPYEFTPDIFLSNIKAYSDEIIYMDAIQVFYIFKYPKKSKDIPSFKEFVNMLPDNFWEESYKISKNSIKNLIDLEQRRNCNLKLSQYIIDNYKKERLLSTKNHINLKFMHHIGTEIANKFALKIELNNDLFFSSYESFLYPQLAELLELKITPSDYEIAEYRIDLIRELFDKKKYTSKFVNSIFYQTLDHFRILKLRKFFDN